MLVLRCELTNDPVSGSFLRTEDAVAAWGSSELVRLVDDPFGSFYGYSPPMSTGAPRQQLSGPGWRMAYEIRLGVL